jgi:hypothetical protein
MEYASRNIFLGVAGKKARQGARVSGYDCALSTFYETQHTPLLSVKCCRVSTVTRYTRVNKRYKSGGTYLSEAELCEVLTEAYQPALERAALEAFEGRYDDVELGQKVDRATIEQKALQLIIVHQEG